MINGNSSMEVQFLANNIMKNSSSVLLNICIMTNFKQKKAKLQLSRGTMLEGNGIHKKKLIRFACGIKLKTD